jgi:NitT/TauT family transport system ATP-binding protein
MQQRVAIARALVSRPQILLLDEPFASVDALTRAELQDVLLRVHDGFESRPVTIVHVTHDIDEAVYLADRVLVLAATPGRVVGSTEVRLRPRSQTTTRSSPRFLAVRNEIHALIASQRANTMIGSAGG